MTAPWGSRRELVELCGGRYDGHQFRAEELPDVVELPELPAPSDAAARGDFDPQDWAKANPALGRRIWHPEPPAVLVYRRTDVVREADGAWLYALDPIPWRGLEPKPTT